MWNCMLPACDPPGCYCCRVSHKPTVPVQFDTGQSNQLNKSIKNQCEQHFPLKSSRIDVVPINGNEHLKTEVTFNQ